MFWLVSSWTYSKRNLKIYKKQKYHNNIYRIQAYDSIMLWYFYIGFIHFMLKGKSLLYHANLFSHNDYEKTGVIIVKYFQ